MKLDKFALDVLAVLVAMAADDDDDAAAAIDDSTDGSECVPLNCCVEDVENATL